MSKQEEDVIIIGAGLSGIAAAFHLQRRCPHKRYRILEARSDLGGTWDLFRYPGIRSDSDMFSFGFSFKPWTDDKVIAPGETILNYLRDAARENGIDQHIDFGQKVLAADWDSRRSRWNLQIEDQASGEIETRHCRFMIACAGYYRYDKGYTPDFPGVEDFSGRLVHPQHWPQDLDCRGKRVCIIGSGATAMTLAPTLVKAGARVTLLQRSPTWIIARPDRDELAALLRRILPAKLAHGASRWRHITEQMFFYQASKRQPQLVKRFLISRLKKHVGKKVDVQKHFVPSYDPWDQRVCLVPRGDFFHAVRDGGITMATDHIHRFDATGIALRSGQRIDSDIIITATGLVLEPLGGISLSLDGQPINPAEHYAYKGMMLNGVPNAAIAVGYTNASWTLKTELIARYVCRLLEHMDRHGHRVCMPVLPDGDLQDESLLDLQAGYVLRAQHKLPKQGSRRPWKLYQNYILDRLALARAPVVDDCMWFGSSARLEPRRPRLDTPVNSHAV